MTFSKNLKKHVTLIGTALGGFMISLPFVSSTVSAPAIAQLPSQQVQVPTTTTITIPTNGAVVSLSQLRVARIPPFPQNPCPSVYYDAPFNQYVVVPQVCRANLITQLLDQMGMLQAVRAANNPTPTGTAGNMIFPNRTSPSSPYDAPNAPY